MKTVAKNLLCALLCAAMLTAGFAVHASLDESEGYQEAAMTKTAPVIDGAVSDSEGWSAPVLIDDTHATKAWGQMPMAASAKLYFAYTADALYFAAEITEEGDMVVGTETVTNTLEQSTAVGSDINYGFDGDTVSLSLDPQGVLEKTEYTYPARYNISFVDGTPRVYRTKTDPADLTSSVTIAGSMDQPERKWNVEVAIPWSIISADLSSLTGGAYSISAEKLVRSGSFCRATVAYMDRYYDREANYTDTWSRYITVCGTTYDGIPGNLSSADVVKAFGIKLFNEICPHSSTEHRNIRAATNLLLGYDGKYCLDCGEFIEITEIPRLPNSNPFTDVPAGKWYNEAALLCCAAGYMTGTTSATFAPSTEMSRAMAVTVMAKAAGASLDGYGTTQVFTDVAPNKWYSAAIEWASEKEIVSGIGDGMFGYKSLVTREQLSLMLYKTAAYIECDTSARYSKIKQFTDYTSIHNWARESMSWCVASGLMSGTGVGQTLSPRETATRAQVAQMVMKFHDNILYYPEILK